MLNRIFIMIFLVALASPGIAAQERTLVVGDVIKVTVYDHPDLTTVARINESGKIGLPLIGEIAVASLSTQQASIRVAQALSTGKYVQRPQVTIYVERFHSPLVSIMGEVAKPGKYPTRNPETEDVRTVADLLALAGGPTPTAADYLTVIQKSANGKTVHKRVDITALLARGDMSQNVSITEGDIVFVPRMDVFYIYGEVHKPGAYRLERGTTLMQALALGGGVTPRGTQRGIEVRRRNGDGKVEAQKSSLDTALQADDVVYVKESLF